MPTRTLGNVHQNSLAALQPTVERYACAARPAGAIKWRGLRLISGLLLLLLCMLTPTPCLCMKCVLYGHACIC